ncbi:YciI family protein [Streptomyces sp. Da 82-17]|uniref:YciI family protein n=1 Tax=Streptomyces sp. Da 82-17 TaxID=3377116 RepID=UPI0038D4F7BA
MQDAGNAQDTQQYLLGIYQPDGEPPAPEILEPIMRKVAALNEELRAAGAWVFAGGLHAPDTATVVRVRDEEVLTTDGPYVEGKEHLGGFTVIRAADLDEALAWGRRLAEATTLPIEVRPLKYGTCG